MRLSPASWRVSRQNLFLILMQQMDTRVRLSDVLPCGSVQSGELGGEVRTVTCSRTRPDVVLGPPGAGYSGPQAVPAEALLSGFCFETWRPSPCGCALSAVLPVCQAGKTGGRGP